MKPEQITLGEHKINAFTMSIQRYPHDDAPLEKASFFSVIATEQKNGITSFVHLVNDLEWFSWLGQFNQRITDTDVVEYNSHVEAVFVKIAQPTWKLSRHSIVRLFTVLAKRRSV